MVLSHVYGAQPDELPVIEELTATGQVDVMSDQDIKTPLLNFIRARDQDRMTVQAVGRDVYKMSIRHPNLISISVDLEGSQPRPRMACGASGMRRDQQFRNVLVNNYPLHTQYFAAAYSGVDPLLEKLAMGLNAHSSIGAAG